MAILINLKSGVARSTKRQLPGLFEGKNRNVRRYRYMGNTEPEQPECNFSICNMTITCEDRPAICPFTVACDPVE